MAKNSPSTRYECSTPGCNYNSLREFFACPKCSEFDTARVATSAGLSSEQSRVGLKTSGAAAPVKTARSIAELNANPIHRTPTEISELDRVLGGGFVDGEVVLFAAEAGSGKSTLSLSVADNMARRGMKVLYSSGEENEQQIGLRAKRMGISNENIRITNETSLEALLGHIEAEKPAFIVVDSLQTIASSEVSGSIGSVGQSKEAAHTLTRVAKEQGISMILINQMVKSGDFAGSEAVQHIVDCCIILESSQDTPMKFLRATKNRFGDTAEVGIFQHEERGLMEVSDPSGIFIESEGNVNGAAVSFVSEGIRQMPVEIQALVTPSTLTNPRKQFNGVQFNRAQIVCAILDKFCQGKFFDHDVFISTVSGIKVDDPIADLAVAAALLSSAGNSPVPSGTAFVGELSLTGQVRGSFMMENKIREAARLGFSRIVLPASATRGLNKEVSKNIQVTGIAKVAELRGLLR